MRIAWLLVCSGCDFIFPLREPTQPPDDASLDIDAPLNPDLPPVCPADARLIACYSFDDNNTLDESGGANHLVSTMVGFVDGIDGRAVTTKATSRLDLTAPQLDTTRVTFDAWIRTDTLVGNQFVIDHNDRWSMMVIDGAVNCFARGEPVVGTAIVAGAWQHAACTFNGVEIAVFVDGTLANTRNASPFPGASTTMAVAGNSPITDPALPFLGQLDRVRVWNAVLTADELRAAAGK